MSARIPDVFVLVTEDRVVGGAYASKEIAERVARGTGSHAVAFVPRDDLADIIAAMGALCAAYVDRCAELKRDPEASPAYRLAFAALQRAVFPKLEPVDSQRVPAAG